ncbi:MAG: magnesium/cobalt transporter CorA [Spirochaetia bacterium]|nr:magnesium/cobalt transporter CorA [Spirochaetia bacterium]
MPESLSSVSEKTGMPPGALVHVGEVRKQKSKITAIKYNQKGCTQTEISLIKELPKTKNKDDRVIIIVEGLKNIKFIEDIGTKFSIHPLVLEDILNTNQRTKYEEFDNFLFIVLKRLTGNTGKFEIDYEQISILIFNKYILVFKEKTDTFTESISRRLIHNKGRILETDYLAYIFLDTIIDDYFSLQDSFDEFYESIEIELLENPSQQTLASIQKIKHELIFVRRSVSPLRELLSSLQRSSSALIHRKTELYLRDIYDHTIRFTETIDSYRDITNGMLDIYLSSVSNKTNEIVKVLTIFTSIFIPMTFITGIYGMNFEFMPELKIKWMYPVLWGSFLLVPSILLLYFKRKKWI